jgi:hypothetical protein
VRGKVLAARSAAGRPAEVTASPKSARTARLPELGGAEPTFRKQSCLEVVNGDPETTDDEDLLPVFGFEEAQISYADVERVALDLWDEARETERGARERA